MKRNYISELNKNYKKNDDEYLQIDKDKNKMNEKNINIIKTYGTEFLKFFKEESNSMPMFLDSACPRAIKKVVMVSEILIDAGESVGIYFNPFITKGFLSKISFTGSSTSSETIDTLAAHLKSYSSFKVICAYCKIMQQSILSSNDGFGTTIDAVIAPCSFDPYTYGSNPNNINVSFFNRINTVDGRLGVKGMLIGTPNQSFNYPEFEGAFMDSSVIVNGVCYLPYGTTVRPIGPEEAAYRIYYIDGTDELLNFDKTILKPVVNVTVSHRKAGVFATKCPEQAMFYAKVSIPSNKVSYRVYTETVVEVIPNGDLLEEIPLFSPQLNYSTARLKQAFEQSFPMLISGNIITTNLNSNPLIQNEEKNIKYYASDKDNGPKRKKIMSTNKNVEIIKTPQYVKDCCKKLKYPIYENLSGTEFTKLLRAGSQVNADINYQFFPIISENNTELAIITYKKVENEIEEPDIQLLGYSNTGEDIIIRVKVNDNGYLTDKKEFIDQIKGCIRYASTNLYMCSNPNFEIDIFSPFKFSGKSYSLALLACIIGAPCGNICTGSFEIQSTENDYKVKINEISLEDVKAKSIVCTSSNPLIFLGQLNDGMTTLISGVTVQSFDEPILSIRNLEEFCAYIYIPPKLRNYKYNYFLKYKDEINDFLLNQEKDNFSLLIYLYEYASSQQVYDFKKNGNIKIDPKYFKKIKEDNYTAYLTFSKGKKYISISEVFEDNPDFYNEFGKKVIVLKEFLYVPKGNIITFLEERGLLNKYKRELNESEKKKIIESNKLKKKVTENEVKESVEKINQLVNEMGVNTKEKVIRKIIRNSDNVKEGFKNLIKELKEIIEEDKKKLETIEKGKKSLFTDSNVAATLGMINVPNSFSTKGLTEVIEKNLKPKFGIIIEKLFLKNKDNIKKFNGFLNKIGIELKKKTGLPTLSKEEIYKYLEELKNIVDDLEDNENEIEKSRVEEISIKEQIDDDIFDDM